MSGTTNKPLAETAFQIDFPPKKAIECLKITTNDDSPSSSFIFTHGAGGDVKSDAIANFAKGFAQISPIVCFKGNMNLKSRIKMFQATIGDQNASQQLGGRSMGARAAVMAISEETTHLVLVSYPLHTDKESRDQILLDLPASIEAMFVSGSNDNMCDLEKLQKVRKRMKCKTWLCVVEGADHGMNVKPRAGTQSVGTKTGEIVAQWLGKSDENATEGRIHWNTDDGTAAWSGWTAKEASAAKSTHEHNGSAQFGKKRKRTPRQKPVENDSLDERQDTKSRKRR